MSLLWLWIFYVSTGVLAAREPTPKTDAILAFQAKNGEKHADKVTRVWHMAYIQNPDMSKRKQKKIFTARRDVVIKDLNAAMDFHDIPMRLEAGKVFVQPSKLWLNPPFGGKEGDDVSRKCGLSLKLCRSWMDEQAGRDEAVQTLDMYFCVFPGWYYSGCAGLAMRPGDVCFVGDDGFLDEDLIGIHHELGHNLGCEHQTDMCFPDYKQFQESTHILVKTLMGGGGACPVEEDVEVKRIKLYSDAEKQFCETENECVTLGTEERDCVGTILKWLEYHINKLPKQMCTRKPKQDFRGPFCVEQKQATCEGATGLYTESGERFGHFVECAEAIINNPDMCPTGLFSFYKTGVAPKPFKFYCMCCPKKRYTSEYKKISMLYRVVPDEASLAVAEFETMRVSDVQELGLEVGVVYLFAVVGLSFVLWWITSKLRGTTSPVSTFSVDDV